MHLTRTLATFDPPIPEAKTWVRETMYSGQGSLLDFSQAAPATAPAREMRAFLADALLNRTDIHLYGAVLGHPDLRAALAEKTARLYNGIVRPEQIGITSGCNHAFAAAIASLTGEGDEVILPTPWYFNHKMWLDMTGVRAVPLLTGEDLLPSVDQARALITPKTRAIALVSPNNPTGKEYPPELLEAFYLLARETGIYLILDETYRDFRKSESPAHEIFADPDWPEALIHLYSFSKAYHLTGHRVGALATSSGRLHEIGKFIDTVTICPTGVGQAAALYGLQNLDSWLASGRQEILNRGEAAKNVFEGLQSKGWVLKSHGAYFAYVGHLDAIKHQNPARLLLDETGVLFLPAHMFRPEGESGGATEFRVAFANAEVSGIEEMGRRLRDFSF